MELDFQLLDCDYITLENSPVIRLFGITNEGKSVCAFYRKYYPYFYITTKKQDDITRFLSDIHKPIQIYSEEAISKSLISAKVENIQIAMTYGTFLQCYMNLWSTPASTTLANLIKKRNLNPLISPEFYNNAHLLENIPDILVVGGAGKAEHTNYKGTTILTNGSFLTEPIYWLINLQTRETFKIDFS